MFGFGAFAFASPWLLAALAALPALWWLLRFTPPAPRILHFPAVRLLFGLRSEDQTPDAAPLWLIVLRLLAAAALIVALAGPLLHPSARLAGEGPVILIIDDGWAAARDWPARQAAAEQAIVQAERNGRSVLIVTTAPTSGGAPARPSGLLRPGQARNIVAALAPKPWPVDRAGTVAAIRALGVKNAPAILWLANGLDDGTVVALAKQLQPIGPVRMLVPAALPRLIVPPPPGAGGFAVTVIRADPGAAAQARIRVLGEDGRLIARKAVQFAAGAATAIVQIDLPVELRNAVARLEIEDETTAGATALLDTRWRRRPVGLLSESPLDDGPSLLSELYYVERALRPFSQIRRGSVAALLDGKLAVIVVPDAAPLTADERGRLAAWAQKGGLILRFAGPRLAQNPDGRLIPVALRRGGRTLGGAMLWTEPARLTRFDDSSPFHGLALPADVTISRQVLAEPTPDLGERTWARLSDGTPLVTASPRGDGWIVLIHTSSNASWSNLALSGLFVEMLERIVATSRGVTGRTLGDRPLAPLQLLDGFGRPAEAGPAARAIAASAFDAAKVGPQTPPGLYGDASVRRALNFGPQVKSHAALGILPGGVARGRYGPVREIDLKPWLLAATLVLLLADALATLIIRGLLPWRRAAPAGLALAAMTVFAGDAPAQNRDDFALKAALETRLAYVVTGDAALDDTSLRGLTGLSAVLRRRTAIEAAAPIGVDVATDPLAFVALLYWPVAADQSPLAAATIGRLNRYMATGGTILFDLLDASTGPGALRRLTRGLDLPTLNPIPPDHILTKAFYLMQAFPGRWAGGSVWVERAGERVNDGVSRIIVGTHDWAAAWAIDDDGQPLFAVVPGGARQREMAYRFGVNLVMYTLTGNYKSDQVHIPAILERLGN